MVGPGDANLLCYGDNLHFLADETFFPAECVDLIYLDPPFNSQQTYNVLFKEASGTPAAAQIKAFEDTWTWDMAANKALTQIHQDPAVPAPLAELMKTFMNFLKASPMMAYLVQMAIRLVHMHRILKPTGSLYLHCDPTASHYLKLVLDSVFGPTNFRNEIVWRRTGAHNQNKRYGPIHDTLLFFSKTSDMTFNVQHSPYTRGHVRSYFRKEDSRGRYWTNALTGAGTRRGESGRPWRGFHPTARGRHWAVPGKLARELGIPDDLPLLHKLEALYQKGVIDIPESGNAMPTFRQYLEQASGIPLQDVWAYQPHTQGVLHDSGAGIDEEVRWIPRQGSPERLGYQTQKPIGLLKRIIRSSSNPGDLILDPFCGCGTTIDAVETLNREHPDEPPRRWIGIDITHLSINLIKHRLTRFVPPPDYAVIGEPAGLPGARALAQQDPFQFQFWALGLIGARPIGGRKKKGADRGIDGVRYFVDEIKNKRPVMKTMLVQVKGGHVKVGDIRDFVGTLTREGAEMGVFVTLEKPTGPMRREAASAEMYRSPWNGKPYPKVQILTIDELLNDPHKPNPRCLQIPGGTTGHTLPDVDKHKGAGPRQKGLDFAETD